MCEGVSNMSNLEQALPNNPDTELYGPSGGPREFAEAEGRFNGGGWVAGFPPYSDHDGAGVVMTPAGRDGEKNHAMPPVGLGPYGADPLLDMVNRWAGDFSTDGGWY